MAGLMPTSPDTPERDERPSDSEFSDESLLKLHKQYKKEAFAHRWLWERVWMRNVHYDNNRHWITYAARTNSWRDVRLAKWVPKPVTPKIQEGGIALRAMFLAADSGVTVRPSSNDPKHIAVAALSDDLHPLLHEEHDMDSTLDEASYWFVVAGNVFLHTYLERDMKHGSEEIPFESCLACGVVNSSPRIADAGQKCPDCGAMAGFQPAVSPETGEPLTQTVARGKGQTMVLSPFEIAFPISYARFSDVPYLYRLRWRSKEYYENHPVYKEQVAKIKWSKAPSERALQLFRSLPYHTDLPAAPLFDSRTGGSEEEEGAPEYELWVKPCEAYPKGLVARFLGDSNPIVLHNEEEEALPGPFPYTDVNGDPVFTFTHAPFSSKGGRIYGTSPYDSAIPKQNQLNQLDSMFLMISQRMGNPLWLVPKGANIQRFTGEPGLVVQYNWMASQGQAKPERIDGLGPNASLFKMRELLVADIENAMGTLDILKGIKPSGVSAFSAIQALLEQAQSRHGAAFKAWAKLYRDWFKFALEIEREFGDEERVRPILTPARQWSFQHFKNADLQGAFTVVVEDGSKSPKTTLGRRANVEHLRSLGVIRPGDPDTDYRILQLFGEEGLSPKLNLDMQAALRKQEAFEEWAKDPANIEMAAQQTEEAVIKYQQAVMAAPPPDVPEPIPGPDGAPVPAPAPEPVVETPGVEPPNANDFTPLKWHPWYNPTIHRQEFLKWAAGDSVLALLAENPGLEGLLKAHLQDINTAMIEEAALMALVASGGVAAPSPGGAAAGAGQAMRNSQKESGGSQNAGNNQGQPEGTGE